MTSNGGAGACLAIANAIKASGVLVKLEKDEFIKIIQKMEKPLVVIAGPAFFSRSHKYLTSYKGLAFYTKADKELNLPSDVEIVISKKIQIPE